MNRTKISVCITRAPEKNDRLIPVAYASRYLHLCRAVYPSHSLCGVPLLEHVMMSSQEAGIGKFVIVVGYRADLIRRWFDVRSPSGISVTLIESPDYCRGNLFKRNRDCVNAQRIAMTLDCRSITSA